MARLSTLLRLVLPMALCLTLVSCSDEKPEDETQVAEKDTVRDEPLPFRMTSTGAPALPAAAQDLVTDTTRLHAPDGKPAVFAMESGHIVLTYKGDRTGRKEVYFKDYGRYQRVSDSSMPVKKGDPAPPQSVLMISTPTFFGTYHVLHGRGWRAPNKFVEEYKKSGMSDSLSMSEFALTQMGAKRLGDTTINGYRTRVYRADAGGIIHTLWIWRDIALREHFFAPYNDIEYWIEPVSLEVNIDLAESLFSFPKEYKIDELDAPPMPGSTPPVSGK